MLYRKCYYEIYGTSVMNIEFSLELTDLRSEKCNTILGNVYIYIEYRVILCYC